MNSVITIAYRYCTVLSKLIGLKYNIWDTMAIRQMNTMLGHVIQRGGGCIPHITNMINSTTKAYKDKIIFHV